MRLFDLDSIAKITTLIAFAGGPLAFAARGETPLPRSIVIPSGIPLSHSNSRETQLQYGFENFKSLDHSGGFGDVAANIGMALNFKKRIGKKAKVRLVITLNDEDGRLGVNKVRDIVSRLMPGLDPNATSKQIYQGIEVYFVKIPTKYLGSPGPEGADLVTHIPKSDLAVQYSANGSPARPILGLGQEQILFNEFDSNPRAVSTSISSDRLRLSLNTGPLTTGIYETPPSRTPEAAVARRKEIAAWSRNFAERPDAAKMIEANAEIAFAYNSDLHLRDAYLSAVDELAKENPQRDYVVFYRSLSPHEPARKEAKNIVFVPMTAFSKEVADDMIIESTLPPLVTGDNSFSTGFASVTPRRSFLYHVYLWKREMADALADSMSRATGLEKSRLNKLFLDPNVSSDPIQLQKQIRDVFDDVELHHRIHKFVNLNPERLDLLGNTLKTYQFLKQVGPHFIKLDGYYDKALLEWWITELTHVPPHTTLADHFRSILAKTAPPLRSWYAACSLFILKEEFSKKEKQRVLDLIKTLNSSTASYDLEAFITSSDHPAQFRAFKELILEGVNSLDPEVRQSMRLFLERYQQAHGESLTRFLHAAARKGLCDSYFSKL